MNFQFIVSEIESACVSLLITHVKQDVRKKILFLVVTDSTPYSTLEDLPNLIFKSSFQTIGPAFVT